MLLHDGLSPVVDGVVAFRDHLDDSTYYYLPAVPELAHDADGAPSFTATAILPEVAAAADRDAVRAMLSFDVELPASTATLDALREEIEKRWGRPVERLLPAPLHGGTASLQVLRPGAAGGAAGNDAEMTVYEGHQPTLIGTNRAAFAVVAEGVEAQTLMAALSVGTLPAVLSYALEFVGLAPSFRATMRVHWSAVYSNLRDLAMTNYLFGASELDRVVEDLQQRNAVEIEVLELDPAGASAATAALFTELKSQIVQKLFAPPRQLGEVPIEDRIGRGVRDVLVAIMPGVTHTVRELDASQLVDTTIDLAEQRANVYPAYPQSTLAGLLARAGGVADRVRWVALDDLPHRVEEVVVELAPGASALGLRRVQVQVLAPAPDGGEPLLDETVELDPADPKRTVLRFRRRGVAQPVVRYRAEVRLDAATAPEGREVWPLPWRDAAGGRVFLDAEDLLDVAGVRVELDDPAVLDGGTRVEMVVEALLQGSPFARREVVFTDDALSQRVAVVVPEGKQVTFRGQERFRRTGEPEYDRDVPELADVHRVLNPFGRRWSMDVRAVADWTATESLHAELRVWEVARRVWLRAEHGFTAAATGWVAEFATGPETPRAAEVRLTRVATDGTVTLGAWRDLVGAVVSVRDDVRAQRRIRARLTAPNWAADDVRSVKVDLRYVEGAPPRAAELVLTGDGSAADWLHDYPDPSHPRYDWRLRALGTGGERFTGPWKTSAEDDIDITLPQPLWS